MAAALIQNTAAMAPFFSLAPLVSLKKSYLSYPFALPFPYADIKLVHSVS